MKHLRIPFVHIVQSALFLIHFFVHFLCTNLKKHISYRSLNIVDGNGKYTGQENISNESLKHKIYR